MILIGVIRIITLSSILPRSTTTTLADRQGGGDKSQGSPYFNRFYRGYPNPDHDRFYQKRDPSLTLEDDRQNTGSLIKSGMTISSKGFLRFASATISTADRQDDIPQRDVTYSLLSALSLSSPRRLFSARCAQAPVRSERMSCCNCRPRS